MSTEKVDSLKEIVVSTENSTSAAKTPPRRVKSRFSYFLTIFALALTFLYYGYCLVAFGMIADNVSALFGWTDNEKFVYSTIISSMICGGQALGSLVAPFLSHRLGKHKLTLITIFVAYVGLALTAVTNIAAMIAGRLIANLATGVFIAIVPIIGHEISPKEYDSFSSAFISNMCSIGVSVGFLLGFGLPEPSPTQNSYWRFTALFGVIPLTIAGLILIFHTKGDSGKSIYNKYKDEAKAQIALARIYREEEVEKELEAIKEESKIVKTKIPFKQLCKSQGKQIALGYSMIISQICSGLNFAGIYFFLILQKSELAAGATAEAARQTTILFSTLAGIGEIISTLGSFYWLKQFKRRPLYVVIFGLGYLALGLQWVFGFTGLYHGIKYCMIGCFFFFGAGIGPFSFIYLPSIMGDSAFGLITGSFSAMRLLDVIIFPLMVHSVLGVRGTILIFWSIGMVTNTYFVAKSVEIKGVSEADIFKHFNRSSDDAEREIENNVERKASRETSYSGSEKS